MKLRANLDRRMTKIEHRLIKMTSLVEQSITRCMMSLKDNDDRLAISVVEDDRMIDQLEMNIEKNCVNVISLQQPIASDLREITAILKIITDLERIGDYSVNIAKIQISLDKGMGKETRYLEAMGDTTRVMLQKALASFIEKDIELAREAAKMDQQVDDMYEEYYHYQLERLMRDESSTEDLVPLLFTGRYLERVGDHIVNICERIIYMVEGINEYY